MLSACATKPAPKAPTVTEAKPVAPVPAPASAVATTTLKKGDNYQYVVRNFKGNEADSEKPYWLSDWQGRQDGRVLPNKNETGIALVLGRTLALPTILLEDRGGPKGRLHMRLVNRGNYPVVTELTCALRDERDANILTLPIRLNASQMLDLVLDVPMDQRPRMVLRIP